MARKASTDTNAKSRPLGTQFYVSSRRRRLRVLAAVLGPLFHFLKPTAPIIFAHLVAQVVLSVLRRVEMR